jgi:predicted DNA-binding protein
MGGNNKDIPKKLNKKSKSYISLKINFNNIPKEIDDLCNEYYNKNSFYVDKEREDFESFFNLTKKEQEKMMGSFFEKFTNFANNTALVNYSNNYENQIINNNSNYSIEEILDSSLDYFTDLNFLEEVLQKAKQEEKYELCSKILKRIKKIKDS